MTSPLAITDVTASAAHGVGLAWSQSVEHSNGVVRVVPLAEDSNGNGLPDWWEEFCFQGPTSANATADSDGDGMTNGQKYLAGTNPRDSASVLCLQIVDPRPGKRVSDEDGATVPLFYENRTPELQLMNPDLNEDIYDLIEAAELDPEQEAKLDRELSWQYHISASERFFDR